ncbi:MAG: hypothetical protein GY730_10375 [bacterium]|nr:hypothetical protein [bacterium]
MLEVPDDIVNIIFKFSNTVEILKQDIPKFLKNVSEIYCHKEALFDNCFEIELLKGSEFYDRNLHMILTLILPLEPVSGYRASDFNMILTRVLKKINQELGLQEKNSKYISHYHKLPDHILPGEDRVGLYFESSVTSINVDFLIDMAFVLMRIAKWRLNNFYEERMNKYYDCENILKRSFSSICVSSKLISYLYSDSLPESVSLKACDKSNKVTKNEILEMINKNYNKKFEKSIKRWICGTSVIKYDVKCKDLKDTSIIPFSIKEQFCLFFSKKDDGQVQTCLSMEETEKIFSDTVLESVHKIVNREHNITTLYISSSTLNKILTNIETGREPFSR